MGILKAYSGDDSYIYIISIISILLKICRQKTNWNVQKLLYCIAEKSTGKF